MQKVTNIGKFEVLTNDVGEIFLVLGKTMLRVSDMDRDIRITFASRDGQFIPHNVDGCPAMIFRGPPEWEEK